MKLRVTNLSKEFQPDTGLVHSFAGYLAAKFRQNSIFRHVVFSNLNFLVGDGECLAILGNNGSGKSTLLRCISGITTPTSGRIEVFGKKVALLSHGFGNYEDLNIKRNIVLVQQLLGLSRRDAEANVS